uniref:Uncharacterized protein n=1 Tax=Panagrolaimus sp. PS1159 TaxID=55785 RepID=A0AC35GZB4_9BILA
MSLYFEKRMNEQKEDDPENDKIVFTFPWILRRADLGEPCCLTTSYKFAVTKWWLVLRSNDISVSSNHLPDSNTICNVSYTLFYDDAMRFELYSSPKVSTIPNPDVNKMLITPNGFMTKFDDEFQNDKAAKFVIFVELIIPLKYFVPPFGRRKCCIEYPANFENNFKFAFLKYK